jgi:REP element-mobilizing transposase RayT
MPRLPRISVQGILYYITCRAPERRRLFKDDEDYRTYSELLAGAGESHVISLFAYTLLPTHVHLLLELGTGSNISEIMQAVNNAYTKFYNSKYQRKGAVFHGRYRIAYVEKEPYLVGLTRHVHLNAAALRLVEDEEEYRYSSLGAYLSPERWGTVPGRPDLRKEVREVLTLLDEPTPEGYRKVLDGSDESEGSLQKELQRGAFLGSDEFVERMKQRIEVKAVANEDTRRIRRGEIAPSEISPKPGARMGVWVRWGLVAGAAATAVLVVAGGLLLYARTETLKANLKGDLEEKYRLLLLEKELELRRKDRELAEGRKKGYGGTRVVKMGAREALEGSVWTIQVTPASGGSGGSLREDTLAFIGGKVRSGRMSSRKYPSSNYTITKRGDDTIVWETMQTGKDGGYACWKGEVRDGKMRGVRIWKRPDGSSETVSFESRKVEFPL